MGYEVGRIGIDTASLPPGLGGRDAEIAGQLALVGTQLGQTKEAVLVPASFVIEAASRSPLPQEPNGPPPSPLPRRNPGEQVTPLVPQPRRPT